MVTQIKIKVGVKDREEAKETCTLIGGGCKCYPQFRKKHASTAHSVWFVAGAWWVTAP